MSVARQHLRRAAAVLLHVWLAGAAARAEVPPISDAGLQSGAGLVVTGYVTAVTERDDVSHPAPGQKLVVGHWTVTLRVEAVEKGQLPPGDGQLRFTGERNVSVPHGWLGGTNTLRLTPMVGDEVRAYLVRSDGGWQLFHHLGLWLRR
jgi:hypothetical protein